MKYIAFVFVLVALISCNDTTQKDVVAEEEQATSKAVVEETKVIENTTGIAMMNFEELEATFLKNSDETVYVINFWATWCKPCIKELPYFETITEKYNSTKVKVLLVSLDFPEKIGSNVGPFVVENKIQSEVVLLDDDNANKWIPMVSEEWSGAIPATIIYKKGNRKFFEGSMTYEELETEIKSLL
jgi:thiol-disulfide isomerase/thioredoxin